MVQLNPVPVFGAKKNTSTIWRKFFTEISVQMVSAQLERWKTTTIDLISKKPSLRVEHTFF